MALSVVDLYKDVLPKTNCRECGFPTCLAFASMVVSEKHPLNGCPHISADVLETSEKELEVQYAEGKWLKRDLAEDALNWARTRAASMKLEDLPGRIGGELVSSGSGAALKLPYFSSHVVISGSTIAHEDGTELTRWEQVFLLNHLAQGGASEPAGRWKGFVEFPNTVSKVKSMKEQVEVPLIEMFTGRIEALESAAVSIGGQPVNGLNESAGLAIRFLPLPKVPVMLMFWDGTQDDGFGAEVKLMFDETVTDHLDIESIIFLSERIRQLLCGEH